MADYAKGIFTIDESEEEITLTEEEQKDVDKYVSHSIDMINRVNALASLRNRYFFGEISQDEFSLHLKKLADEYENKPS